MGDTRVVTISSPSHFQDLMDGIWNYFVNKYKVDIEITCNGHSLSAHQIVLEIMCPALKMPLTAAAATVVNRDIDEKERETSERKLSDSRVHPVTLNLDHVVSDGEDVALLVEFIYRGKMSVPLDRLDVFHDAARVLGLNSLVAAIDDFRRRGEDAICTKENEEGNGGGGEDGGGGGRERGFDDDDDENDDDCDLEAGERGGGRAGTDHNDVTGRIRNRESGESGGASSRRKRKRTPVKISQMMCESKEPSSEDDDRRGANGDGPPGTPRPCRLTRSLTQWRLRMETRNSRDRVRKNRKDSDMEWTRNPTTRSRLPKSEPSQESVEHHDSDDGEDHGGENDMDASGSVSEPGGMVDEEDEEADGQDQEAAEASRRTSKQPKTKQPGKHTIFGLQRGGGEDGSGKTPSTTKLHKPKRGARKSAGNGGDQKAARSEYSKLWRRNRPPRKCPHCPYETRDKDNYNSHLAKHDPNLERFTCEVCSKKFRNKRGYVCHRRGHLDPELLHRCFHCTFYTPQKASLVQHLAVKHRVDKEGKPLSDNFQCSECDFRCITDTKLKVHVKKKHLVDKPFKCTECDYSTFRKGDFDKHVSIRHRHERPYMCEVCGFRSQTQSGYERHKRSHTGEKPYKCDVCGQLYADGRKLKVHLQRHINDEKPFVCHLCGHASRRKDNLQIHLKRIHKTTLDGNGAEMLAADKPHSSATPDRPIPTVFQTGHRLDGSLQSDVRDSPCVTTLMANVPTSHYTVKKAGLGIVPQPLSDIVQQHSKQPPGDQQSTEDVSPSEDEAQQVVVQPMVGQILASDQEQTLTFIVPESAIQHINFFQFPFK